MTRKISEMLTNTLMLSGAVSHEKQEVIIFGLELLISSIIGILIIIAISIIAGVPLLWIAFLLSFIPLRTTAGGYHALTHTGCNITFAITYIICVVLYYIVSKNIHVWFCENFAELLQNRIIFRMDEDEL